MSSSPERSHQPDGCRVSCVWQPDSSSGTLPGRSIPTVEPASRGVLGRAPSVGVVWLDVRFELAADLLKQWMIAHTGYRLIEILVNLNEVNVHVIEDVEASVAYSGQLREFGCVRFREDGRDLFLRARLDLRHDHAAMRHLNFLPAYPRLGICELFTVQENLWGKVEAESIQPGCRCQVGRVAWSSWFHPLKRSGDAPRVSGSTPLRCAEHSAYAAAGRSQTVESAPTSPFTTAANSISRSF